MMRRLINKSFPFKSVFVLGGSSEIAQEICIRLIKKGVKKIHFVSKEISKNQLFSRILPEELDVEIVYQEFDLLKGDLKIKPDVDFFDLYIIAAGYLGNSILANNDLEEAINISKINYYSLIPWLCSITTEKRISKPGAMWILSSVAGDHGRASNYHYGAAKAALTIFCEGLLNRTYKKPFKIRILKAGFIYTSMTIGKVPKILCVSKKYFANSLIKKPYKSGIEYLPFWWFFIMKIISILPKSIMSKL